MISDLFSKQGAPHEGSLVAPACQCSVQTSTFLRMGLSHGSTIQVRSKTKKFQVQTNREIFDLLRVLNKDLLQGQQLMARHSVVWFDKSVLHVGGRTIHFIGYANKHFRKRNGMYLNFKTQVHCHKNLNVSSRGTGNGMPILSIFQIAILVIKIMQS